MNNDNKKASKKKIIRTEIDTSKLGKLEDLPPQEVSAAIERMIDKMKLIQENMYDIIKGFSADINQIDPSGMDPDDADVLQVFQEVVDKAIEKIDSDDIVINLDDVPSFKRAPLPSINTYSLLNDKVTNKLPITSPISEELDGQLFFSWNINGAPQNAPAVATFVTLSNSANELNINRPINAFDMAVYNAISTRFFYWNQSNPGKPLMITPQEIWRTMDGKTVPTTPSAAQIKKVRDSIDKMQFTKITIDTSQELKANYRTLNDERVVNGTITTYLINADKLSFLTEKGNIVDGYRINQEPILYAYSKAKNHILYFDYALLDTSSKIRTDENMIIFKNYILSEVTRMVNGLNRNSNRIKFDTIYKNTGILPPDQRVERANYSSDSAYTAVVRRESKRDRDKMCAILNVCKENSFIQDYVLVKEGRSFAGIDISLFPKHKTKQIKKA